MGFFTAIQPEIQGGPDMGMRAGRESPASTENARKDVWDSEQHIWFSSASKYSKLG